jgi:hypothetical protein
MIETECLGVILGTEAGENVRIQAFLDEIQVICNTSVWGSEERWI